MITLFGVGANTALYAQRGHWIHLVCNGICVWAALVMFDHAYDSGVRRGLAEALKILRGVKAQLDEEPVRPPHEQ